MTLCITYADLVSIVRSASVLNKYIWNDGATTWDLKSLLESYEAECATEMLLDKGPDSKLTLTADGYTEEGEKEFVDGFRDAIEPLCPEYPYELDVECSCPWCAPWNCVGPSEYMLADTPYDSGRKFAESIAWEINDFFSHANDYPMTGENR